jgi:hypothetical protein
MGGQTARTNPTRRAKEKPTLSVTKETTRSKSRSCPRKLQRLLDSYLDGDVERELYQDKRAEILGEKKRLQEQIEQATLGVLTWVEPMKQWIETAVSICKIAKSDDLARQKVALPRNLRVEPKNAKKKVVVNDDQFLNSPQENIWVWLRQSLEKIAPQGDNKSRPAHQSFKSCSQFMASCLCTIVGNHS